MFVWYLCDQAFGVSGREVLFDEFPECWKIEV